MTVREFTSIRCDEPRCRAIFPSGGKPMPTGWVYARKQAAIAGWSRSFEGYDFCPTHSEAKDGE